MKAKHIFLVFIFIGFLCCKKAEEKQTALEEPSIENNNFDVAKSVSEIETFVKKIEANKQSLRRVEITTKDLRSQIKQKWSKIHFYVDNDKVVRVKAYPYPQISNRTEEFYFDNESLVFAIILDEGEEGADKDSGSGKQYYFKDGKFIKEVNNSNEKEQQIRNSDSERLAEEASEYLEIYKSKKN